MLPHSYDYIRVFLLLCCHTATISSEFFFVCLFVCLFVGIKPENLYFASRPGLEVRLLGVSLVSTRVFLYLQ